MEPRRRRKGSNCSDRIPIGQRIEVATGTIDELVRGLAAATAAVEETVEARGGRVAGGVEVEGAAESSDGAGEVAADALPSLGRREGGGGGRRGGKGGGGRGWGGVAGRGGGSGTVEGLRPVVGLHEDLLHHVLVRAWPSGPALERRCHLYYPAESQTPTKSSETKQTKPMRRIAMTATTTTT